MSVIALHDYQRKALDALHALRAEGKRRLMIVLPTGGGKTFVAVHAHRELALPRTVFMVHRDELVRQTINSFNQVDPDLKVGVCKAERDELHRQLVIVSAQTIASERRLNRLREAVGPGCLFISDEAHHDAAPSRRRALQVMEPAFLLGLTATPERGDGLGLHGLYDEIAYNVPMLELVASGKLSTMKGLRINTRADLDAVHTVAGEFNQGELAETVNNATRNKLIVDSWFEHARDRIRTVAFCVNKQHAYDLRDMFRARGIPAETIEADTPSDERALILERFKAGKVPRPEEQIRVLTNCMVLTEGYDEPNIDCELMCRPTKSRGLYVQMVGRAARRGQEKDDALIIDFVDGTTKHSLVTFPTLAGRDGAPVARGGGGATGDSRPEGQEFDLLDMAREVEGEATRVNLFAASKYLWRQVGGVAMAPAGQNSKGDTRYLFLQPEGEGFVPAAMVVARFGERGRIHRLFDRAIDAETAMALAEGKVDLSSLTDREARWRTASAAPSPAQLRAAAALGVFVPATATKGQVSALLDERAFMRALQRAQHERETVSV